MSNIKTFKQNAFLVGKVVWGKASYNEETKNGKKYNKFAIIVQSPEGVGVVVEKTIWNPEKEQHPWVAGKVAEFESIIESYSERSIYVMASISPNNKTGKMFDTFSVYQNDEGKNTIKMSSFPTELDFTEIYNKEDDTIVDDVKIHFSKKDSLLSTISTTIDLEMIVAEINGNEITLVSEDIEYPTMVIVELDEGIENKAKKFSAYKFQCELVKGERIESAKGSFNEDSWEEEAEETTSGGFATNFVRIKNVKGVVKGLTIGGQMPEDDGAYDIATDF